MCLSLKMRLVDFKRLLKLLSFQESTYLISLCLETLLPSPWISGYYLYSRHVYEVYSSLY